MVEIINKILKVFAALSLLILSISLVIWVILLPMQYSTRHILLIIGMGSLVFLFVGYSLALLKQVFYSRREKISSEILDQDEIDRYKNNDL